MVAQQGGESYTRCWPQNALSEPRKRENVGIFSLKLPPNIKITDFLAQTSWIQQIKEIRSLLHKHELSLCAIFTIFPVFKDKSSIWEPKPYYFVLKLTEITKNVDFLAKFDEKTHFQEIINLHEQATNAY